MQPAALILNRTPFHVATEVDGDQDFNAEDLSLVCPSVPAIPVCDTSTSLRENERIGGVSEDSRSGVGESEEFGDKLMRG